MRLALAATALTLMAMPATAQQFAANDGYRVCPQDQTTQGLDVVKTDCGGLQRPDLSNVVFNSLGDLEAARGKREAFTSSVEDYGQCVTKFINSYRRPGAPADSDAPDQAACAHSWAEDQATQLVREYGKACVEFSNRSMTDRAIEPWSGDCYPKASNGQG